MKKIVVFSGAGMSAESGLRTFRDSDGLWEEYDIHEVATPEAWQSNPKMVLEFYNMRRRQVIEAQPNEAHVALKELESHFELHIITQNIDDLHERAGSKSVLHLHGDVRLARSSVDEALLYPVEGDLNIGNQCEMGSQLRPHVVWFGEGVPVFPDAVNIMENADIVLTIGTSLNVYPAASLVTYAPPQAEHIVVDPAEIRNPGIENLRTIQKPATEGVPLVVNELIASIKN
ncbi:MAG: NAD-dependent deacylase [Flavobacteriales bacterium]|nr:NAD-dependent deacylase [Flavobacteriales bacterium]NCG30283.1 NAD-dependent deacylase [Bacteroidota bacterium]MBT3962750.1 NAD-dependent deacylase [Flavobacteriales bacterium]MBT4929567.1 NAD-dependent deacylase [Flavobacteriales bacterium]MBT5131685.1 NAD-dependent deacylase [Flavobacteriales bacterium]